MLPEYSVICKEDDHEKIKYSVEIEKILKDNGVECTVKKKLLKTDYGIIQKIKPDFIFVFGWRTMIDTELNAYCKYGIFAAHYSLLPKYRGFAPMQWAIINGEKKTGVTIFKIENGGVDSGRILFQKEIVIKEDDFVFDVERKLTEKTIDLFTELVNKKTLNIKALKNQDEKKATYTCKRTPDDGKINWEKNSAEIYDLIRALAYPYTGAFCFYKNEKYLIRKAEPGKMNLKKFAGRIAGRVIKTDETGIEVLCGSGTIKITEWENPKTGKIVNPAVKVRSYSDTLS